MQKVKSCCQAVPALSCSFLILCLLRLFLLRCFLTVNIGVKVMIKSPQVTLQQNKPTCARVAAMTTVAHNTSKQLSVNAKVNFSLLQPYA